MLVSSATLAALRTTIDMSFRTAYSNTETWWQAIASRVPSSTRTTTYAWVAEQLKLRKWVGPRQEQAMRDHNYLLTNEPYEATFSVSRDDILDDNLGMFESAIVPSFASAVAKHPDTLLVSEVFEANPVGFDGVAFFHDAHPSFDDANTTYDNNFDLALDPDDIEASAANVEAVRVAMMTRTGENGLILGVNPNLLIVPPQLQRVALEVAKSDIIIRSIASAGAAAVPNVMAGMLDVLVIQELGTAPTTWYMFDVSKPIKPFLWQVRSNPVLKSPAELSVVDGFQNNKWTWGIDGSDGGSYRGAPGVSLPFLASRSEPGT